MIGLGNYVPNREEKAWVDASTRNAAAAATAMGGAFSYSAYKLTSPGFVRGACALPPPPLLPAGARSTPLPLHRACLRRRRPVSRLPRAGAPSPAGALSTPLPPPPRVPAAPPSRQPTSTRPCEFAPLLRLELGSAAFVLASCCPSGMPCQSWS